MTGHIAKYTRRNMPGGRVPTTEEIAWCVQHPGRFPEIEKYLKTRPGQKVLVEILSQLRSKLSSEVEKVAYQKFLSRGEHGLDQQDWYKAEDEVSQELEAR